MKTWEGHTARPKGVMHTSGTRGMSHVPDPSCARAAWPQAIPGASQHKEPGALPSSATEPETS